MSAWPLAFFTKKTHFVLFLIFLPLFFPAPQLLGYEIRVAIGLLYKVAQGRALSRREKQQLVTTAADIFRLVVRGGEEETQ